MVFRFLILACLPAIFSAILQAQPQYDCPGNDNCQVSVPLAPEVFAPLSATAQQFLFGRLRESIEETLYPSPLLEIEQLNLPKNNISYCKRPMEAVDSIILHHSGSNPTSQTAEIINSIHRNRETPSGDKWLMIGYHYTVNVPYEGDEGLRVTTARPIEIVGAHAGGRAKTTVKGDQRKALEEGISCGRDRSGFRQSNNHVSRNGTVALNVTSIGVVVIGNYAAYHHRYNRLGFRGSEKRLLSHIGVEKIARLACELQRSYPSVKKINWHSAIHQTACPGTIKESVNSIIAKAKEYGCQFE